MTLTRLDGEPISNITHMEFGPDGLLYASSLTGTIYSADNGAGTKLGQDMVDFFIV
jgi:hypothetical protein